MLRFLTRRLPVVTGAVLSALVGVVTFMPRTASAVPGVYTLDAASWTSPGAFAQGPLSLSVRLTSSLSGWITKVRFYKDVSFTGSHTAFVWNAAGSVLAQQAYASETASGWQEVTLNTPVVMNSNTTFSVGFTLDNGFVANGSGFPSMTAGPLTIINGYYKYAASVFPDQTVGNNYLIDLTFVTNDPTSTTTTSTSTTTTTSTTVAPTTSQATTTVVATTAPSTTAAPALQINISAPVSTVAGPATTTAPATTARIKSSAGAVTVPAHVTTTSTSTVAPAPTSTVSAPPQVANLGAGEAAVRVGDTDVASTLSRENNRVTVHAGDVTAEMSAIDKSGKVTALDARGNIRLAPGSRIHVNMAGFKPRSSVEAWMFSVPFHLGSAEVSEKGAVSADFSIPSSIDPGQHRIAVEAVLPNGEKSTVALAVSVGGYEKESNIGTWLIVTPIVLAVLVALFIPAARRRRSGTVS